MPTATQTSIDVVKEEETKEGMMARWWTQFTKGVSSIQRRIYSKTNLRAALKQRKAKTKAADTGKTLISGDLYDAMISVDPDSSNQFMRGPDLGDADQVSVETVLKLMDDGLSVQEIILLANQPATEFQQHTGRDDDMMFIQFYQLAKGSPNFDQSKLDEMAGNRMIGFKTTKEIFIPQPSQTSDIEAQRQQQMEWATMLGSGIGVQVSARDPHMQHYQTLVPAVADHMKIAMQSPPIQVPKDLLNALKMGLTHGEAHLQAMMQQGANERQLKPQILQQKDLEKMYGHLMQNIQQAEMQAAQMQAMAQQNAGLAGMSMPQQGPPAGLSGPMGMPMGPNAAGMGGPPPGQNFQGQRMAAAMTGG